MGIFAKKKWQYCHFFFVGYSYADTTTVLFTATH